MEVLGVIDEKTVWEFYKKTSGLLKMGAKHLIVDLKRVAYIGSGGTGLLVKVADDCIEQGGRFGLVDVPSQLLDLFNLLGLLSLISYYDAKEQAIEDFLKR